MPISMTRSIKEDAGTWVVTDSATLPMGQALDTTVVDKGTLVVTKRNLKQGPVEIEVAFKDGKATGTFSMNGQSKPIAVDLGGALFADGAGAADALARLPLADGYATTFRNFDLQKQRVALKQVKVVGTEDITVAAGSFKAWKVEVTSAEGEPGATTLWIATDSRKVVKSSASLPAMGGAIVTSELQP